MGQASELVDPFQQVQQRVFPFYLDGTEISGRMRAILVDWLIQLHARFQLMQDTLYMCVAIIDRFLQVSLAFIAHMKLERWSCA